MIGVCCILTPESKNLNQVKNKTLRLSLSSYHFSVFLSPLVSQSVCLFLSLYLHLCLSLLSLYLRLRLSMLVCVSLCLSVSVCVSVCVSAALRGVSLGEFRSAQHLGPHACFGSWGGPEGRGEGGGRICGDVILRQWCHTHHSVCPKPVKLTGRQ